MPPLPMRHLAHRLLLPVWLLAAAVLSAAPAPSARLTRGPYLQLLTTHSVTIVWNTDVAAACSLALRPLGGAATVVTGGTGTVCAIPVSGLAPGARYGYVPQADGVALADETILRTDDPSAPFSFLVLGDSGSAGLDQFAVRDRMLATPADFILSTGDMVYEDGAAADFDPKFFEPYRELIRRVVFWPTLGNHDWHTAVGQPWRDAFYTPANNAAGSENYYSFDFGNAHVAVLNSNAKSTAPGSAQYTFLDQDLGASTALWKFVAFHHTIYSSGTVHGSNMTIRGNLVPLFDKHHVDIVFMGHDHEYERTVPLQADLAVAPGQGTVYITTGGGGQDLYQVGTSTFTAYAESVHHYTRVAINGSALLERMIRDDGSIGDSMTLGKGSTPPPPTCGDGLVNQPTEQCDGADHPACRGGCNPDCTCAPVCGNGKLDQASEQCDGQADAACPGLCLASCRCGTAADFVSVAPVADTYIEAGTQATWDHGASALLSVDAKPYDLSYLKFDLSAVTSPVVRATLMLSCTNGSVDGGTVYPVSDSSWVEGDRTGLDTTSADGPGLKWNDVDTNLDGKIDARDTSAYVPSFFRPLAALRGVTVGQTASVDVTPAFTSGPGLYTLAITNRSTDRATYASNQDATGSPRPVVRLEVGTPLPTTTTTTIRATTTTATVITTTTTTTTVPGTTLELAPVADTFIQSGVQGTWDHGASTFLAADAHVVKIAYLKFDLSTVTRPVVSATLTLYCVGPSPDGGTFYRVGDSSWIEGDRTGLSSNSANGPGLKWIDVDTNHDRKIDGGDTSPFVPNFTRPLATLGAVQLDQPYTVDLTALFQAGPGLYSLAIRSANTDGARYASRNSNNPPQRPVLHLVLG